MASVKDKVVETDEVVLTEEDNILDLKHVEKYKKIFEERNKKEFGNKNIIRPERMSKGLDNWEKLSNICRSDSMKTAIKRIQSSYISNPDIYDIIYLVNNKEIEVVNNKEIEAFIIVKREKQCRVPSEKPVISLEAICSSETVSGAAKRLLGFLIYNAIVENFTLILKVDQGIENIAAYCLYSNLGFKMDPTLVKCYGAPASNKLMENLYMILEDDITVKNLFLNDQLPICANRELQNNKNLVKQQLIFVSNILNVHPDFMKKKDKDKKNVKKLFKKLSFEDQMEILIYLYNLSIPISCKQQADDDKKASAIAVTKNDEINNLKTELCKYFKGKGDGEKFILAIMKALSSNPFPISDGNKRTSKPVKKTFGGKRKSRKRKSHKRKSRKRKSRKRKSRKRKSRKRKSRR